MKGKDIQKANEFVLGDSREGGGAIWETKRNGENFGLDNSK